MMRDGALAHIGGGIMPEYCTKSEDVEKAAKCGQTAAGGAFPGKSVETVRGEKAKTGGVRTRHVRASSPGGKPPAGRLGVVSRFARTGGGFGVWRYAGFRFPLRGDYRFPLRGHRNDRVLGFGGMRGVWVSAGA
jgi:hypothetical protein